MSAPANTHGQVLAAIYAILSQAAERAANEKAPASAYAKQQAAEPVKTRT